MENYENEKAEVRKMTGLEECAMWANASIARNE